MSKILKDPKTKVQALIVVGAEIFRKETAKRLKAVAKGTPLTSDERENMLEEFTGAINELQEALGKPDFTDSESKQILTALTRTRKLRKSFFAALRS